MLDIIIHNSNTKQLSSKKIKSQVFFAKNLTFVYGSIHIAYGGICWDIHYPNQKAAYFYSWRFAVPDYGS
jgi:hypothetical protein